MSNKGNTINEAPFIKLWKFKMRFPGIHYKFEPADYVQGLMMGAVCLSIIPILTSTLGMPFEVAIAIVILNGFFYLWHSWLGDPVVPGWVTPAIPLLIAYVSAFPAGPERMHALIAFQMVLGVWCLFLGVTGLSKKVITSIPQSIKAGVILGAGILAINLVFCKGGKFEALPITVLVCALVALFMMYNPGFKKLAQTNKVLHFISNLGILPAIIMAIIVAAAVGEAHFAIQWGITKPAFGALWTDWVPWGKLGWPSFNMYISSLPLVLAAYIVIFGEAVQGAAVIADAQPSRPDEIVEYDPDRSHLIVGIRNAAMSVLGPDISMCGPLWAAMTVVIYERWKKGADSMKSIYGGVGSFRLGTFTMYWLLPLVSITKPILTAALSLTMTIQGFVAVYVGIREARSLKDLGIAGIVAGLLVAKGAAWAFGAGIVICLVIYGKDFFKGDTTAAPLWADQAKTKAPIYTGSQVEAQVAMTE